MRSILFQQYHQCRSHTIQLLENIFNCAQPQLFNQQIHPDFSPIGWHFGHIIYTQELWLLRKIAGYPSLKEQKYDRLFASDGLPKAERQSLPDYEWMLEYGQAVTKQIWAYWHSLSLLEIQQQEKLWYWLIQHECQHYETIYFLLHLTGILPPTNLANNLVPKDLEPEFSSSESSNLESSNLESSNLESSNLYVPSGSFPMGCNSIWAMDNESCPHQIYLPEFSIASHPVCRSQFQEFIEAGGYTNSQFWTEQGWHWLQTQDQKLPQYWHYLVDERSIVYGLSWYEADAYSKFVGKQLPSEAQWEKAVKTYPHLSDQFLGRVWQWTSSYFCAYPNFCPYPYGGYSSSYFDDRHMVLRGGSWATLPWVLRPSFRNWYSPDTKVILAGLRCATANS